VKLDRPPVTDIFSKSLRPSGQAIASRVGDETVLLHLETGAYYGLDAIGTRIWELLTAGIEPIAICQRIAEEYDARPEEIRDDIRRLLEELEANRILIEA
jgi:hypothetical protein